MLTTIEKVLVLKSINLFSKIPREDLSKVALIADEVSFPAEARIIEEGELGDSMYLIVKGKVRIHKKTQLLATLGEKECFGEMAILDNEPRSASVTAVDEVVCLRIDHDDFYDILADKIEIARGIFKVLTHRLREANQRAAEAFAAVQAAKQS